jgi:hypothetical protein
MPSRSRTSVPPVDELTTPSPSPSVSGPLMFQAPEWEPEPATSTSEPASPSDLPPLPESWPSSDVDEASASDRDDAPSAPSSSPASSGSRTSFTQKATQEGARKAVEMAGGVAHQLLARDDAAKAAGVYLTDADDQAGIGNPVGSIVHRHGFLGDVGNPDVVDGINALIALGVYAWKQVGRLREAARMRRELHAAESTAESAAAATGDVPTWPAAAA